MTISTHYFLTGAPAKIHDFLTVGHRLSNAWRTLPQNRSLMTRITNLIGRILWILTWPCQKAAEGIEWTFKKSIDPQTYLNESLAWKERFNPPEWENCDLGLIELLVRSKIKISDCPFEHIIACRLSRGVPQSLFIADGEYKGFTHYFSEAPKKCLVFGIMHGPEELTYFRKWIKDSRESRYAEEVTPEADEDSFGFKCQYYDKAKYKPDQLPPAGINEAKWVWLWRCPNIEMTYAQRERIVQHFRPK
jgi:hypothetical protein